MKIDKLKAAEAIGICKAAQHALAMSYAAVERAGLHAEAGKMLKLWDRSGFLIEEIANAAERAREVKGGK